MTRRNVCLAAAVALGGLAAFASPEDGAFTVSGWVCPTGITDGKGEGLVWSWGNGWSNGMRLTLHRRVGGFFPSVHFVGCGGDEWFRLYSKRKNGDTSFSLGFNRVLKPGERAHLATVFDGKVFANYLNGVRVDEVDYSGTMIPGSPKRWSFKTSQFGTGAMTGELVGFTCREKVLTDEEIAAEVSSDACEWDRRPLLWRKAHAAAGARRFAEAERLYREIGEPAADREAEAMRRLLSGKRASEPYGVCVPEPRKASAPTGPFVYVSPAGDDAADGSEMRPLRTLPAARNRLRQLRGTSRMGGTVYLKDGEYVVGSTLELTEQDGGSPGADVVWSAAPGARVALVGWRRIPAELFRPWTNGILVADVRAAGFTGLGPLEPWGIGLSGGRQGVTDLYDHERPLERARHPNAGFATIREADDVAKTFRLDGISADDWRDAPGLMAAGYWHWYWEDQAVPVAASNGLFKIADGFLKKGKRPSNERAVYLVNALRALDAPGEWFLDSEAGKLYLKPRDGQTLEECRISQTDGPFFAVRGASNIVFRGLSLVGGRSVGFELSGDRLTVEDCRIGDFGCRAATFKGKENVFRGNHVKGCGGGAIVMKGEGQVDGNRVSDLARHWRTYSPAVLADGRGIVISRNEFHHMRSSAIRLEGNDHLVVSNDVHDCVLESDDQGAVDIWGTPAYSGIRILANRWTDIGRPGPRTPTGQAAVRLDDWVSRVRIEGNVFVRCGNGHFGAVQMNKGRGNAVENNLFVDCHRDVTVLTSSDDGWRKIVEKKGAKLAKEDRDELLALRPGVTFERNVMVNTRTSYTGGRGDNRVFRRLEDYDPKALSETSALRRLK